MTRTGFTPGPAAATQRIVASEALSVGDYVNVHDSGGAFRVRKATASEVGREAHGYVLAAAASGAVAVVHVGGVNTGVTGQAPGTVWLSTTAGAGTATAPTTVGHLVQVLGRATSATAVAFAPSTPLTLA